MMKMLTVYILRSKQVSTQLYVGLTNDVEKRLEEHNSMESEHTRKYAPWEVETKITFKNPGLARRFERYLKSGSGRAFRKKHLISNP